MVLFLPWERKYFNTKKGNVRCSHYFRFGLIKKKKSPSVKSYCFHFGSGGALSRSCVVYGVASAASTRSCWGNSCSDWEKCMKQGRVHMLSEPPEQDSRVRKPGFPSVFHGDLGHQPISLFPSQPYRGSFPQIIRRTQTYKPKWEVLWGHAGRGGLRNQAMWTPLVFSSLFLYKEGFLSPRHWSNNIQMAPLLHL